jgi:predicted RNA-binding protein YlqC (UPF0109 family)
MKDTLSYIVTSIVEHEDKVDITEDEDQGIINLTVSVDPSDMGKVIGKEGKVIKAIRNVMRIPAMKQNKKIYINLAESSS